MKSLRKIMWITVIGVLASCASYTNKNATEMEEKSRPVDYVEVATTDGSFKPGRLTTAAALEDVGMFGYLLTTAYAGLEYNAKVNSFNAEEKLAELTAKVKATESMTAEQLEADVVDTLFGIVDGHLAVVGSHPHGFATHRDFYFAPVILGKKGTSYTVAESLDPRVPLGARYTGPVDMLFRTLPSDGEERFLPGQLSNSPISDLSLQFNGKTVEVAVSQPTTVPSEAEVFSMHKIRNGLYLRLTTLDETGGAATHGRDEVRTALNDFVASATECRSSPFVVLDLRANGGGNDAWLYEFIGDLYQTNLDRAFEGMREIVSPATNQAWLGFLPLLDLNNPTIRSKAELEKKRYDDLRQNPRVYWYTERERQTSEQQSPDGQKYNGKLVVLVDRYSGSAGESIGRVIPYLKGAVLVGENTAGHLLFGNVLRYYLKNSGIAIMLPSSLSAATDRRFQGDGAGYFPDFWLGNSAVDDAVRTLCEE